MVGVAHLDDMEGLFWGLLVTLLDTQVHLTLVSLTDGEKGVPSGSALTPEKVRSIRRAEQQKSLATLGITDVIYLGLPDLELHKVPEEEKLRRLITAVRAVKPGAIVTFDPLSQPKVLRHVDHEEMGRLIRHVGDGSDVERFFFDVKFTRLVRPELWFLTFNQYLATHQIPFPPQLKERRNQHLREHFPTQFPPETEERWKVLFDANTDSGRSRFRVRFDRMWFLATGIKLSVVGRELYRRER